MEQNRQYDIFISYRRLDEQGNISGRDQARLIAKQLELEGYHPFFDYSEIKDDEFDKVIIPAVENSKVFILVLTKDALNRCKNEDDWVRREIETAIKSGSKIINVSPDNTFNGWPNLLPEPIRKITKIQISEVHFGSLFELSIKKLLDERIIPGLKSTEHQKNEKKPPQTEEDNEFIDSLEEIHGELSAEELYQKGLALFHGRGVEKDKFTAVTYYEKAAKLEHPMAQRLMYVCCLMGIGIREDVERAHYWLEKAANNHEFFAMHTMAETYCKSEKYEQAYKYFKTIVDEYELLYEKNRLPIKESGQKKLKEYYTSSIVNIGKLYEKGLYLKKDYEQAKIWYRKAKALGNQQPMAELLDRIKAEANEGLIDDLPDMLSYDEKYELAKRYLLGIGLEKSFEKAMPLLLECAQNGMFIAYKDLGFCYAKGVAVKKGGIWGYESIDIDCKRDYLLGYQYLIEYAKSFDDGEVFYELGLLCELGLGTQQDFSNALSWYKKAIKANCAKAVDHIATMFRYGKIRGDSNMEKYIICSAFSEVISLISIQNRWDELRKDNPQLDLGFIKPRFYIPSFFDYSYSELRQYYVKILKKEGITIEVSDDEMDGINGQSVIENVISSHWSSFESRIRDDFSNIMNCLLLDDICISYALDSFGKGIEAVDLGLTSGTLWGSINVYEKQITPCGNQFAWAESKSKESFSWGNYFDHRNEMSGKFKHINHNRAVFYDEDNYDEDNIDCSSIIRVNAAADCFGDMWTIPSHELMQEIIDECEWVWDTHDGVLGYNVFGKNGNHIFLPTLDGSKEFGSYWSFSLNKKDARYADILFFDKKSIKIKSAQRYMGLMIRPIAVINNRGIRIHSDIEL